MLWIIFGVSFLLLIVSSLADNDSKVAFGILTVLSAVGLFAELYSYNETKTTADLRIAVLEQRNEEVVGQIEPLVRQYLNYEENAFKNLKPDADTLVTLSNYPELKGNEFVQTQIQVILENQKKITNLKLAKAELASYYLWIFMGE